MSKGHQSNISKTPIEYLKDTSQYLQDTNQISL